MKEIKVVIGANFGDEGKGLMTDYFCSQFKEPVLNVRYNGTCQAGHTVVKDDKRHIFSHFGAGSFNSNTTTFLSSYFFTNPILFNEEYEKLEKKGISPKVYVSKNSHLILIYDILYNRLLEVKRSNDKHGSCGMGLWESVLRDKTDYVLKVEDLKNKGFRLFRKIKAIRDLYFTEKSEQENVNLTLSLSLEKIDWFSDMLIDNYINECYKMLSRVEIVEDTAILNQYDYIVFEGAQGLLLDWGNRKYMPNLTASYTGLLNVNSLIEQIDGPINIEVCYVSRSYLTRHGAGIFETEVDDKSVLGVKENDKTNGENLWQGHFRYGYFDTSLFIESITRDIQLLNRAKKISLSFTHLDEIDGLLVDSNTLISVIDIAKKLNVNCIYKSYAEDSKKIISVDV